MNLIANLLMQLKYTRVAAKTCLYRSRSGDENGSETLVGYLQKIPTTGQKPNLGAVFTSGCREGLGTV